MTRIAAYCLPDHPWAAAFIASAEEAGATVQWLRGSLWTPDQREVADLVISAGSRGPYGALVRAYAGWGVPAVVMGPPRHRVAAKMYGFFGGDAQGLPPAGVPGRREKLAPDAVKPVRDGGSRILVIGQRIERGFGEAPQSLWLAAEVERAAQDTGLPVVYRPHSLSAPLPHPHTIDDGELSFDDVALVVTYDDVTGYEAILEGVPVRCHPSAFYAPWSDLRRDRDDLVDRVLATQWTMAEVAAGAAWDFMQWWLAVWAGRWNGAPPTLRHAPMHVGPPESIGVYADETQEWAAEMVEAIEAGGSVVHWQAKYRATEMDARKFGAVLCYGARRGHAALLAGCEARGVPALIGDLPRYRPLADHYGFFAGDLHALPPEGIPGRRMALAPDAIQPVRYGGDHILVLGQKPGDASHRMTTAQLSEWLSERATAEAERTGLPVVYRPHPYAPKSGTLTCDHTVQDCTTPISFDGVALVICYTSTGGFEAILAGVPVVCNERAFYAPWATLDRDRENLLDRVLATQWSPEERRDGTAWAFLWRWMSGQLAREATENNALAEHPLAVS